MCLTDEELLKLKEECEGQGSNCGGCETCDQTFGVSLPFDYALTWKLVHEIQNLRSTLSKAREHVNSCRWLEGKCPCSCEGCALRAEITSLLGEWK